jgi:hypothetical protein
MHSTKRAMAFRYEDVDADSRARIEQGVVALARINTHHENIQNWMAVGAAYIEMQHAAMRLAHVNQPKGGGYNVAYKVIVAANPYLDVSKNVPTKNRRLDSVTAAHATWMAQPKRRAAIEAWHAEFPENVRQRMNHPTTIKRNYEKAHPAPGEDGSAKPAGLKAEVARLREELDATRVENDRLKRARDNVTEGADWTWSDDINTIAEVWLRLQPTKVVRIASRVMELSKGTAKRPSRKTNREPPGERHWS